MSRKRIVIIVVAAVAFFLGAITLFVLINGDRFKSFALESMNEKLSTELSVEEMGLSVWAEFPMVTVNLKKVVLMGSVSHSGATADTLIRANSLGVALSLWDVLFGEPKIDALVLEDGVINVRELKNGTWNTSILESDSASKPSKLTISKITLRDVKMVVEKRSGEIYSVVISDAFINEGELSVSFNDITEANGDVLENILPLNGYVETQLNIGENNDFELLINDALVNDIPFSGSVKYPYSSETGNDTWEIKARTSRLRVNMLKSIWKGPDVFKGWSYDGSVDVAVHVTDRKTQVVWSVKEDDFAISPNLTGLALNKTGTIAAQGKIDYLFSRSNVAITVESIALNSNGIRLIASASCSDFKRKPFYLEGEVNIDASSSYSSWVPSLQGVEWASLPNSGDLFLKGGLQVSATGEISHLIASITSSNLEGSLDASPYSIKNLSASYKRGQLDVGKLDFNWSGNKGELSASIKSIDKAIKGGEIVGEIDLSFESIVVGAVLTWWDNLHLDGEHREPISKASLLPNGSDLAIQIESKRLFWDELALTSVRSSLKVGESRMKIVTLKADGLQGSARVEGSLRPGGPGWVLGFFGSADGVALPELFLTYNNFGQSALRSEHLEGAVSAAGTINLGWDLSGEFVSKAVKTNLEIDIDNGRLKGVEIFDEIADYLKTHRLIAPLVDPEDLRTRLSDIEFKSLESPIYIASSKTTIPFLKIKSSAMDVTVEGVHSFKGDIDYTLGFALRDLRNSREVEFGSIEDDGLGTMFFLAMDGSLNEPIYSYDREAHKSHRRKAFDEEAKRIKEAIRNSGGTKNSQSEDGDNEPAQKSKPDKKQKSKGLNDLDDEDF